ncbi:hypothetical protein Tco_1502241 [Tanacetum coccineum]
MQVILGMRSSVGGIYGFDISMDALMRKGFRNKFKRVESIGVNITYSFLGLSVYFFARMLYKVIAISIVLVSLNASEDSVGTSSGWVILFGTIPTIIPDTTPIVTPLAAQNDIASTPTEIPSDYIPPLPALSPFLSSTDTSSDSATPDTPPSPTHDSLFWCGRPYRYHPNEPVHMMTTRKRVGPLPTHRLAVRHPVDYSSSDYFTSDDSSSETSSDFSSDDLANFTFGRLPSDHPSLALPSGMRPSHQLCSSVLSISHSPAAITERLPHSSSASLSRKRSRSPTTYVPVSSPTPGALMRIFAKPQKFYNPLRQ